MPSLLNSLLISVPTMALPEVGTIFRERCDDNSALALIPLTTLSETLLGEVLSRVYEFLCLTTAYMVQFSAASLVHENLGHGDEVVLNDKLLRVDKVEGCVFHSGFWRVSLDRLDRR